MVETGIIMIKRLVFAILLFYAFSASAQEYTWKLVPMDGSRVAAQSPSKDNVSEKMGTIANGYYVAPSGRKFHKKTATYRAAEVVLDAQPTMAAVKEVIGYSPEEMVVDYPESALSNWLVDNLMKATSKLAGKPVDLGIANFGGIRIDMPKGDIILDDMLSMFPFNNNLVYMTIKGSDVRKILEHMISDEFQILGGLRVVVEDGKLVSAEVAGEPLDDNRIYSMATITFLMNGGDGLSLATDAIEIEIYDEVLIIDFILEHIEAETKAGRPITYEVDGRLIMR